jgi:hypothetical protein
MPNFARDLGEHFTRRSPTTLLAFGIVTALADSLFLYFAASREGVLHVSQGVGLLENYGLISAVLCNAIYLYLARRYYADICSMELSKAVVDEKPVERSLSALKFIIEMRVKRRRWLYQLGIYLSIVGMLAWLSNLSTHLFGDPMARWGHKVFDSTDHPLTFTASRLHNFYTWVILLPLVGHVIVYSSIQLWLAIKTAASAKALSYDLLNPDQRGGLVFVDKAAVTFNVAVALAYIQITMHIETFKMNTDHIILYVVATALLIAINRLFLGGIYAVIGTLRVEALNKVKERVYENDKMSFEILKYCYERRVSMSSIVNFAINPGAIVVSGLVKLWPVIAKSFGGAGGSG